MSGEVRVELSDAVLTVTFDRPAQHNAMTFAMYEELHAACERADSEDDVRMLVLRGAGGRAFVAGTDIATFRGFDDEGADGVAYEARISRVVDRLEDVRVPTLAVVEGHCMGGGLALAAVCDLRLATPSARFGVPIARTLGNCLSMNSVSILLARLGAARTLEMLMLARSVDAEGARSAGFVSEVCEPDELEGAVERMVATLLSHAPLTMWATKTAVARQRRAGLADGDDLVARVFGSQDFHRAVEGFGSGRPPGWEGR